MPTLAELQNRTKSLKRRSAGTQKDEAMIVDRRGTMRPAQLVEQKLRVALSKSIR